MLKRLRSRLRSKRGESLTEVLVAVLISSIALLMLASMVGTTQDIVRRTKEANQTYVSACNVLVEKNVEGDDLQTGVVEFSISSNDSYFTVKLTKDASRDLPVLYYVNDKISGVEVTSYKKGGS